jgi:hypothetical protein
MRALAKTVSALMPQLPDQQHCMRSISAFIHGPRAYLGIQQSLPVV